MIGEIGCMGGNCGAMFNREGDSSEAPSVALCRHVQMILSDKRGTFDWECSFLHRVLGWWRVLYVSKWRPDESHDGTFQAKEVSSFEWDMIQTIHHERDSNRSRFLCSRKWGD